MAECIFILIEVLHNKNADLIIQFNQNIMLMIIAHLN